MMQFDWSMLAAARIAVRSMSIRMGKMRPLTCCCWAGVADWEWQAPSQLAAWWMEAVRAVLAMAIAAAMLSSSCSRHMVR